MNGTIVFFYSNKNLVSLLFLNFVLLFIQQISLSNSEKKSVSKIKKSLKFNMSNFIGFKIFFNIKKSFIHQNYLYYKKMFSCVKCFLISHHKIIMKLVWLFFDLNDLKLNKISILSKVIYEKFKRYFSFYSYNFISYFFQTQSYFLFYRPYSKKEITFGVLNSKLTQDKIFELVRYFTKLYSMKRNLF